MRTIVITGASGGVAQEMVKLLPNDQLILVGRSREKLVKLYSNPAHCEFVELDITNAQSLENFTKELYSKYVQVDVLVNNAGYGIFEEFDKISNEDIHAMFEVNTFALMNLSRLFGERMKQVGRGHIVNIVSTAGLIASAKSSLYSATKFAGIGFSNALRLELMPYNVYVTTVNPGPIKTAFLTKLTPMVVMLRRLINTF
ncbi:KR domain protein [Streptococcus constellatus subsp. pharyngis SK1060 = CCUG 46377]|uniref:KR domain protein n=1 Tax=Streptococcus constellatus subsp. pharyngis SK1060 = CCUG 46377 TaxID=1035184 RepID=F9P5G0_STRCV|nr:KR domain protein [Streptococcus constellatus subsp. pharyngis SK1060 = CCUG 46377]